MSKENKKSLSSLLLFLTFTHTHEILNFVSFCTVDRFTRNIFFHSDKRLFNIEGIGSKMLHRAMQRNGMEVAVPGFGV